jgi:hypothetical protein
MAYFLLRAHWRMSLGEALALVKQKRPVARVGYQADADKAITSVRYLRPREHPPLRSLFVGRDQGGAGRSGQAGRRKGLGLAHRPGMTGFVPGPIPNKFPTTNRPTCFRRSPRPSSPRVADLVPGARIVKAANFANCLSQLSATLAVIGAGPA